MMEVFEDIEQGTEQWFRVRAAIPTASMFKTVLASGQDAGESKTRRSYMLRLAGERITGEPAETYSNWHMERGRALEQEARNLFAFMHDVEPVQIGFIRNGQKGCSPDSLINERGLLEIKTALPHILIDHILNDRFPPEHRAQVQGQLWIAEREYNDLMIYWPGLPPLIKRTARDEKFITKLSRAVAQFNEEVEDVVSRIRSYGGQEAIADQGAAA